MRNAQTINAINTVQIATQIMGTMAVNCVRGAALVVGKFHHVARVERYESGLSSPVPSSKRCGKDRCEKRLSDRASSRRLYSLTAITELAAAATAWLAAWMWPASFRGQSLSLATGS